MNSLKNHLSRRRFLAATGALFTIGLTEQRALAVTNDGYFSLGVASGCPRPDQVILWTRLAPDPLNGGGMANHAAAVRIRVSRDEGFRNVILDELVTATADEGHSIHSVARGLEPGRDYWYQFSYDGSESPIGRTKTADPAAGEAKIALAYCQHYETGFFAAYRDLAEWAPDCVIHTGDYIYEYGPGKLGVTMRDVGGGERRPFETVRLHQGPETTTLWDYRNRYALYRTDPHLQAAHAAAPWIFALDDHEVDNNWAGDIPQDPHKQTPVEFLVRKIAAFQAYYEHMPIERPPVLDGLHSHLQMYGAYRLGPAQIHLLDTRQYRSDQACGDNRRAYCDEVWDPTRTMLGKNQEAWLTEGLKQSDAPYNLIATSIWFTPYRYNEPPADAIRNLDSWDGYPAARQRLTNALTDDALNPVFLTGDWHTAMASTIHEDPFDSSSKRIGHELVGSSISSHCPWAQDMESVRDANPHVAHLNGNQRGYLRTTVTKRKCVGDFRVVKDAGLADSPVVRDIELSTNDF